MLGWLRLRRIVSRGFGLRPVREIKMIIELVFAHRPAIEKLVHDQHPPAVARVEEFGRLRVVGRANGVDAQFAQRAQVALPNSRRHGGAKTTPVRVQANSLELEVPAVQPEAGFRIEVKFPDAEGRGLRVNYSVAVPSVRSA